MASFNLLALKRKAHNEGRQNAEFNPFSLNFRNEARSPRSETWDAGSQLEGGQLRSPGLPSPGNGFLPLSASQSAPVQPSSSRGPRFGNRGPAVSRSGKEQEAPRRDQHDEGAGTGAGTGAGASSGGDASLASQQSTSLGTNADGQNLVRRKTTSSRESQSDANVLDRNKEGAIDGGEKKKKKNRTFFKHLTPKTPFTVGNQITRTLFNSWINVLLIAAPVGIALNYVKGISGVVVFVVNFIAIVPLAAMLSFATEEIALRTGETVGGLLNATFGNAVELIIAIIALIDNKVVIVQTSLIGSILSNLLLVLGMCFFFGGLRRQEQFFNTVVAQTAASLLALAVAGVIVPTVFDIASNTPTSDVAKLSRGTSVVLLFVYGGYLFFQLKTHSKVFAEPSQKVEAKPFRRHKTPSTKSLDDNAFEQGIVRPAGIFAGHSLPAEQTDNEKLREHLTTPPKTDEDEEEEGEEPQLHFYVAIATLLISTVIIAFCAEFMVDGIDSVTGTISAEFVGLILLPIVGNAAEHATAVTVAIKDKMDLAIGVAVGSSMQVALFIIPLLVIIGWGLGKDAMSLSFDPFQVAVLFVAVLLVNYLIADGKSHWLEGMLLMCLYIIIAVCSWWYPTSQSGEKDASAGDSGFNVTTRSY
ncbi:Sodium/calcium exchanger protein-domain-containing protein [Lasiosphaeria ovina]|uniref:Sodium/calcium exchanger protein-domain-containing protein n=1 Tax=Lasiosphaeria ovina TaxID=92902 RepID=A0AAE0TT88_9PEZI|nr:Sodium/calcium exchanger protein-domain-containing protein [Lasiosphaeria ovina]